VPAASLPTTITDRDLAEERPLERFAREKDLADGAER